MGDAVATQVLYEDANYYVAKFTNVSDGTGESAVAKVDVSALTPACARVQINKIIYSTYGMGVDLYWDATTNVLAWSLGADDSGVIDFVSELYPLVNNAGTGITGDVLFTTIGHGAGDTYSIILECKKM